MALTKTQQSAILALITCNTQREAARKAGCAEATISVWMQNDTEFILALRGAESQALNHASRQIATAACEAVELLREIVSDPESTDSVRISAARAILSNVSSVRLTGSIEQRLLELEQVYLRIGSTKQDGLVLEG